MVKPRNILWSDEDERILKKLIAKGYDAHVASEVLNRTVEATRNKAKRMGLSWGNTLQINYGLLEQLLADEQI